MLARCFLLFAACALLTACQAQPVASSKSSEPRVIAQWSGDQGGGSTAEVRVLRTADEWTRFWRQVGRDAPRALDVSREMAVVVTLGEKRTGGYAVAITGIREQDGRLLIDTREIAPARGMMVTQALTHPWAVAIVPGSDRPVGIRPAASTPATR